MKKIILAAIIALSAAVAHAGLLVEPQVGWTFNQHLDAGHNYNSGNGVSYGGRLGWQKWGGQIGLDYLSSSIGMSSNDFKRNMDTKEWAAFLGYKFPVLFKVYGAYIFDASANTNINNGSGKFDSGTGWKLGVGTTILPFLDINLEYREGQYGSGKVAGQNVGGRNFQATMLSISLPFNLFD
ncbi:MAG: outer membrane beta-barrel protein [Bacteriovoracaceae bacterium]